MFPQIDDILADRQETYGDAKENFIAIGRIWGALLRIEDIEPHMVALMLDGMKSVRCSVNPYHNDSWVDKIGYTEHAVEILTHEPR
jgi:hypothetical protein